MRFHRPLNCGEVTVDPDLTLPDNTPGERFPNDPSPAVTIVLPVHRVDSLVGALELVDATADLWESSEEVPFSWTQLVDALKGALRFHEEQGTVDVTRPTWRNRVIPPGALYSFWWPTFCFACDRPLNRVERRWHHRRHRLTAEQREALADAVRRIPR